MRLNIYDVLQEKNLNKEYIIPNLDCDISFKLLKDIDGTLILKSSDKEISKIYDLETIWMEEFVEVNTSGKKYA